MCLDRRRQSSSVASLGYRCLYHCTWLAYTDLYFTPAPRLLCLPADTATASISSLPSFLPFFLPFCLCVRLESKYILRDVDIKVPTPRAAHVRSSGAARGGRRESFPLWVYGKTADLLKSYRTKPYKFPMHCSKCVSFWGTSYSRSPNPYLTSPLLQNPGGATGKLFATGAEQHS